MTDVSAVLEFLGCRTPAAWLEQAVRDTRALLMDHASLELKAAQQAQRIIWKYGMTSRFADQGLAEPTRKKLLHRMSRLAREELRHFEQVAALLEARGSPYEAVAPSRYAGRLHESKRRDEPGALIDTLLIGAIIEARSCERFYSLVPRLERTDAALARFYSSLLQSEARHFEDYLALAREIGGNGIEARTKALLVIDAELVQSRDDAELRFHSGVPTEPKH